jgi:hypothetical protein
VNIVVTKNFVSTRGSKTKLQYICSNDWRLYRRADFQLMGKFDEEIETSFFSLTEAKTFSVSGSKGSEEMSVLLTWIYTYLMAGNRDLGRTGAVCPFTKQAAKLDTVRVAMSFSDLSSEPDASLLTRRAFTELNLITTHKGMEHFRTVIIGFPRLADESGIAALKRIQRAHRAYSLARGRMIGLMHASSEDQGLWNTEFRPLRSPIPILAVRHMVEQDAPFAALHPALMISYLARFPLKGVRRLANQWRGG